MTALVMRLSAHVNGVSREHGRVSREMWQHFWPGLPVEEVPIRSVTTASMHPRGSRRTFTVCTASLFTRPGRIIATTRQCGSASSISRTMNCGPFAKR